MKTNSVGGVICRNHQTFARRRLAKFQRLAQLSAALVLSALGTAGAHAAGVDALRTHHEHHPTTTPAPTPTPNPNCTLIVPAQPLTAAGLATPYQLVATDPSAGACHEANTAQSAFVQAAILDPATGAISIYSPLVVDQGTTAAVAPVVPALPKGAIVGIWFGFDGDQLTLKGSSPFALLQAGCINGTPGSIFGQYAYCNAPIFFAVANQAIARGQLKVPALGTAADGKPCPTVRDFFVVDQDQSDNLPTNYLATADGRTAQYSTANLAALPGAVALGNPSDNGLLDKFVAPALGCRAWTAADLANPGNTVAALPLNELQARAAQLTPVALMPAGDPMTEVNGEESLIKTNLYRAGVDQPLALSAYYIDTARYCRQLLRVFPTRLLANQAALTAFATPDAGAANSLYTFLAQRFVASYDILECDTHTGQADPVAVTLDGNDVATAASVDGSALQTILTKLAPYESADDAADSQSKDNLPFE